MKKFAERMQQILPFQYSLQSWLFRFGMLLLCSVLLTAVFYQTKILSAEASFWYDMTESGLVFCDILFSVHFFYPAAMCLTDVLVNSFLKLWMFLFSE